MPRPSSWYPKGDEGIHISRARGDAWHALYLFRHPSRCYGTLCSAVAGSPLEAIADCLEAAARGCKCAVCGPIDQMDASDQPRLRLVGVPA